MYVLVLGLDVLGNPFGLIRGLSEGVEAFFYEPFQVQQKDFLILDFTKGLTAMLLLLLLLNDNKDDDNISSSQEYYLVLVFNTYTLHYISNGIIYWC